MIARALCWCVLVCSLVLAGYAGMEAHRLSKLPFFTDGEHLTVWESSPFVTGFGPPLAAALHRTPGLGIDGHPFQATTSARGYVNSLRTFLCPDVPKFGPLISLSRYRQDLTDLDAKLAIREKRASQVLVAISEKQLKAAARDELIYVRRCRDLLGIPDDIKERD